MRWSKIKNIIIILLVVVNAALLAQVGLREWNSRQGERETRERVVAVLERNDIAFLPQEVPGELELTGCRVAIQPPGESEAALLVGEITDIQTSGVRTVYTGTEGTVTSSSAGELTVEFAPGKALTGDAILDRLSRLGVSLQRDKLVEEAGKTAVTYFQLRNGVPIPGETAVLTVEDGEPQTLTLRLLAGSEESVQGEGAITASTALTRFLDELNRGEGYVCSQITGLYPGYLHSGTTTVTLTPAWFIETDTWRFAVDGYTGSVSASE